MHPKESLSTLFALLAATKALGISRADVNGTLRRGPESQGPSMVLFDSVPGGAGHVRRILERFDTLLVAAREVVESCECGIDSSCYACIRTYDNQQFHEKLSREDALRVFEQLSVATAQPTST
jgi:ATP-dependent helicase YprA (DUF1998 family)